MARPFRHAEVTDEVGRSWSRSCKSAVVKNSKPSCEPEVRILPSSPTSNSQHDEGSCIITQLHEIPSRKSLSHETFCLREKVWLGLIRLQPLFSAMPHPETGKSHGRSLRWCHPSLVCWDCRSSPLCANASILGVKLQSCLDVLANTQTIRNQRKQCQGRIDNPLICKHALGLQIPANTRVSWVLQPPWIVNILQAPFVDSSFNPPCPWSVIAMSFIP